MAQQRRTTISERRQQGVTVLERGAVRRAHRRELDEALLQRRADALREVGYTEPHPGRALRPQPKKRGRRLQKELGSKQVIVERGRRVAQVKNDPHFVRFVVFVIALLSASVGAVMFLSAHATSQTFSLQDLKSQETQLDNELESLHRDLESVRSSAEIARRASEMGFVVPDQPGVLEVSHGAEAPVAEVLASDAAKTRPLVDVNGNKVRASSATSNPAETRAVTNSLDQLPRVEQVSGVAPYSSRGADVASVPAVGQPAQDAAAPAQPVSAQPMLEQSAPAQPAPAQTAPVDDGASTVAPVGGE